EHVIAQPAGSLQTTTAREGKPFRHSAPDLSDSPSDVCRIHNVGFGQMLCLTVACLPAMGHRCVLRRFACCRATGDVSCCVNTAVRELSLCRVGNAGSCTCPCTKESPSP